MIVIHIQAKINPENRTVFLDRIRHDSAVSRQFAGCTRWSWAEDVSEANRFVLYEEWETPEAFAAYRNSAHFKEVGAAMFPLIDGQPVTAYFQA
jgi:quinol monooxygenase YgiN